jgi:Fic family protein
MTKRTTGRYEAVDVGGRDLPAFVPHPLPPTGPALAIGPRLRERLTRAEHALAVLATAEQLVGGSGWLVEALVRREIMHSSRLADIAATGADLLAFEADEFAIPSAEVADARRILDALWQARARLADGKGPGLTQRTLCDLHRILARDDEGSGTIRGRATWIGAKRPEGAVYVPPPPSRIVECLASLEKYVSGSDDLPPLVRVALVHVEVASIHPFSDGNGRIARLLVPVLAERWGVLGKPLLCLSPFFHDNGKEYYRRVDAVRTAGDWEGWIEFFLDGVVAIAGGAVAMARDLVEIVGADRGRVLASDTLSAAAVRLFELLPRRPLLTVAVAMKLLDASKPTAGRAVETLVESGVLVETTGRKRDRWFAYRKFIDRLDD